MVFTTVLFGSVCSVRCENDRADVAREDVSSEVCGVEDKPQDVANFLNRVSRSRGVVELFGLGVKIRPGPTVQIKQNTKGESLLSRAGSHCKRRAVDRFRFISL